MRKKLRFIGLILCCILLLCSLITAYADNSAETTGTDANQPVKVGFVTDASWLMSCNEDGTMKSGYAYDYIQTVAKNTGWQYEYVFGDMKSLLHMLMDGKLDILPGVTYSSDTAANASYPYYAMGSKLLRLYTLQNAKGIDESNLKTINGKNVGIPQEYYDTVSAWFEENGLSCKMVSFGSDSELKDALNGEKVSAIACLENDADDEWKPLVTITSTDYYLAVSKGKQDILKRLNGALATIYTTDPYFNDTLYYRYSTSRSSSALSAEETEWFDSHDKIICGYLGESKFNFERTVEGTHSGVLMPVMDAALSKMGLVDTVKTDYTLFNSTDEMIRALNTDRVDVIFPVLDSEYVAENRGYAIVDTIAEIPLALITTDGNGIGETETIVVPKAQFLADFVQLNYPGKTVVLADSEEDCLNAVLRGAASASILPYEYTQKTIEDNKSYSGLVAVRLAKNCGAAVAVRRGNATLWKLMNRGLKLVGTENITEIVRSFEVTESSFNVKDLLKQYLWMLILGVALIVGAIILIIHYYNSNKRLAEASIELEDASQIADQASKEKSLFLYRMTHDILTPVNSIMEFAEEAKENVSDKKTVKENLKHIEMSCRHIKSVIDDSNTIAKIDSGNGTLEESLTDLSKEMEDVITMIEPLAEKKSIDFSYRFKDITDQIVYCDSLHVNQIMINLLNNAVKYTKPGGRVRFTLAQVESEDQGYGAYKFLIQDTGVGMTQEEVAHVFDAYYSSGDDADKQSMGSGLGLPLAKKLVDLMGGRIDVRSEKNVGTTISCYLNFRKSNPDNKDNDTKTIDLAGKKILIVDDEEISRTAVREALEEQSIVVEEASDGEEAVKLLSRVDPKYFDAVIMDIQMPGLNGYEATRQIRSLSNGDYGKLPIIALTANVFEEDRYKSFEVGMNAHMTKPVQLDVLLRTMSELIAKNK